MRSRSRGPLLCALACALLACGEESTAPRPAARRVHFDSPPAPTFLINANGPLTTAGDSVWVHAGRRAHLSLFFAAANGADSIEFLRFIVPRRTTIFLPDGTPLARGDSVLIRMHVIDPRQLIIRFEPSGLRFDAGHQAELLMHYARLRAIADDDDVELLPLTIWKRESADQPWSPLPSVRNHGGRTLQVTVEGFTDYAIAY